MRSSCSSYMVMAFTCYSRSSFAGRVPSTRPAALLVMKLPSGSERYRRTRLPGEASKHQLQCELHQPRPTVAQRIPVGDVHRTGNGSERRAVYSHVRQREVRVVEEVEELAAELQVHPFGNFGRLQH